MFESTRSYAEAPMMFVIYGQDLTCLHPRCLKAKDNSLQRTIQHPLTAYHPTCLQVKDKAYTVAFKRIESSGHDLTP